MFFEIPKHRKIFIIPDSKCNDDCCTISECILNETSNITKRHVVKQDKSRQYLFKNAKKVEFLF